MPENKELLEYTAMVIKVFMDLELINEETTVKELALVIDESWLIADANQKVIKN
jgi:hypothetical protein